jgi:urea transporter
MKNLLRETHRRSVWQVLAVYVGVSWAVLQVVDVLTQNMGLPTWVFPFALVLLLIGLPWPRPSSRGGPVRWSRWRRPAQPRIRLP